MTTMKQIMDDFSDFSDAARAEGNYWAAMVYTNAESLANNGHGLPSDALIQRLKDAFTRNMGIVEEPEEKEAWSFALEYLESL